MLTNFAKQDLLNLMSDKGTTSFPNSHILPNPSFDGTTNINYINDIQTKLSITGFTIIDIIGYKDYKIVYGNANNKGILGIFDLDNNLIETVNKVDDYTGATTGTVDLDQFKLLKVNGNGFIYGIVVNASKTYFIRFSDILDQIGVLASADIDVFYTARVDMSTETPQDPAKPAENIMGTTLFNDYEKIYMSNDFKDDEVYSFALWKASTKNVRIVQIGVPNGSITQDSVDWKINEDIIIGTSTVASDFSDISGLGIATGSYNNSTTETLLGSVIVETTKTSSAETWAITSKTISKDYPNVTGKVTLTEPSRNGVVPFNKIFTFDFSDRINEIKTFYDTQPIRNQKTTMTLTLNSFVSGTTNTQIQIDETTAATIIANNNLRIELDIYAINFGENRANEVIQTEQVGVLTGNTLITEVHGNFFHQRFSKSGSYSPLDLTWNIKPSIVIKGTYEFKTTSSARATTELIAIIDGKDNGAGRYEVRQALANIYKGSKPVFLNEIRAYVPLLSRDEGRFNIYEFTPLGSTTTEIEKSYIDHTPSTQPDNSEYTIPLIDLVSGDKTKIVKILVNGTPLDASAYERTNNNVKILSISKDKTIIITYKSNVPSPKKLFLNVSTSGSDVYITGINNQNELNTTSDDLSIVGIGDNDGSIDYGFTLYSNNSNTELNTIAENSQSQGLNLKHIVATRQNDLMFIYGYNQDFTKEMKWVSIYPQSFSPYTFRSFEDKKKQFHLERLNCSETADIKDSRFDKAFDNVSSTSGTIVANTNAKTTDFNYTGKATLTAYGKTNKAIFVETVDYSKTRQETKEIYLNVNVNINDITDGNIPRNEASTTLAKIFSNKNEGHEELIQATKLKVFFTDGTNQDFDVTQHLSVVDEKLKLDYIIEKGSKTISKIQWLNKNSDLLGEKVGVCDFPYIKINWEIAINGGSDGGNTGGGGDPSDTPKWGTTKWGGGKWV